MKNIINYEQPKYIYLPYDNEGNVRVNADRTVLVEESVCTFDSLPIFSTVSGKVLGSASGVFGGKNVNALLVENDLTDRKKEIVKTRPTVEYGKNDIQKIVRDNGFEKESNVVIALSLNYIKKYDESDYLLVKEYGREILDTLDKLAYAYSSKEVYVLINKDKETKGELSNYLGIYPNIKLVKKIKVPYSSYSALELIKIHNILKQKSRVRHIYLTINNKGNVVILKTKKYVNIKEVLALLKVEGVKVYDINKNELNELTILDENIRTLIIR